MDDQRGIAMVLNSLGGARRDKGDLDAAISDFEWSLKIWEALEDQRGIAMVLNSLGSARRDKGDLDAAISDFERSLKIWEALGDQRGIAMVLNSLGGARRDRGDLDAAIADLERSLKIGEAIGDQLHIGMVLNNLGGTICLKGEIDRALDTYGRLRNLRFADGTLVPIKRFAKGIKNLCNNLRKWKRNLEACEREEQRKYVGGQYHLAMGRRRFAADDDHGAYLHLKRALSVNLEPKEQAECWFHLGRICARLERHREAVEAFRSSLLHDEGNTVLYASLGHSLHQAAAPFKEIEEAFERAFTVLDQSEKNAWAHSWYALALKDHNQLEPAEQHARKAVEMVPDNVVLLTNLGQVLMAYSDRSKLEEAVAVFERAQEKAKPGFRWPTIHLATVRERLLELQ